MLRSLNTYYQQWKQTDPSNIDNWSDLGLSFHDSAQYCSTLRDNWVICLNINDNAKSLLISCEMQSNEIVFLMCLGCTGQYRYYQANTEINRFYQLVSKPMGLKPFNQYSDEVRDVGNIYCYSTQKSYQSVIERVLTLNTSVRAL